jgi:hypothetical protein
MRYSNVIALHLDNFNTDVELSEVLKDAGLNEKGINCKEVLELKTDGYDILYFDVNTGNAIAYHVKGMVKSKVVPMQPFIQHMCELPCVSEIVSERPLDLDEILDQIKDRGLDSLTARQKTFLDIESKRI